MFEFFTPLIANILFLSTCLLLLSKQNRAHFIPCVQASAFLIFHGFCINQAIAAGHGTEDSVRVKTIGKMKFSIFQICPDKAAALDSFFKVISHNAIYFFQTD